MEKLWILLQKKIQEEYDLSAPEWVQVDISRSRKIHVTLVSDRKILKDDIRKLIMEVLDQQQETYSIGFLDIYSLEKAQEFNITKTKKTNKIYTWADGLNADGPKKEEHTNLNIISFYSYKGGVGRTIAMIQTAYNLAKVGKRVLMLDLDIEAPSLHNLFSNEVNNEVTGVKYGMIEYLYRTVVQKKEDASLSDIYCSLHVSNVDGGLFLIPALKSMNKDYIYQIGRLQTEQIQDQNVFKKLFDEIEQELGIDIILIDTRAGFNPWGSLSLLSLSTQVIFVAYPNTENIEGLNIAFEMMKNVGKKRYAVVMSKVVATPNGVQKAVDLFGKLEISQDSVIPIYYKEEIALSNDYPIETEEVAEAYSEISDYILDSERVILNRNYLSNGKKQDMLEKFISDKKKMITLSGVSRFLRQDAQSLLVYRFEEEIYGLLDEISVSYTIGENVFVPVTTYLFYDRSREDSYKDILADETLSLEEKGLRFLQNTINTSSLRELIVKKSGQLESIEDVMECLKETVSGEEVVKLGTDEETPEKKQYEVTSKILIIINVREDYLQEDPQLFVENMKGLITTFNKNIEEIQFKFVIEYNLWEKYQGIFAVLKGAIMQLEVLQRDIHQFICKNINMELFRSYMEAVQVKTKMRKGKQIYQIDREHTINDTELQYVLELIFGIRKQNSTYSTSVDDYIYSFFVYNKNVRYDQLLDALKSATQWELEGGEGVTQDRLISFCNLQRALEQLSE